MQAHFQTPNQFRRMAANVLPPLVVVPTAIWLGFNVFYQFNKAWRCLRIGSLWTNPDNFVQLGAGVAFNLALGNQLPVRVAALSVWIPSQIVNCVDQYNALGRAYQKWKEAIRGDYAIAPQVKWISINKKSALSPSTKIYIQEIALGVKTRFYLVIIRTYKLGKRIFVLSMVSVDALEAMSLKRSVCDRAVNEFFMDGVNTLERITDKKAVVLRCLNENKPLVEKMLKLINASITSDRLIKIVDSSMEGLVQVNQAVRKVKDLEKGVLVDLGKQMAFSAFSIMGIPEGCPKGLIPGKWERMHFEEGSTQQYVPNEWLTRPSALPPKTKKRRKVPIERSVKDITVTVNRVPGKVKTFCNEYRLVFKCGKPGYKLNQN